MQPRNHASRLQGLLKTNLQGSEASTPQTLQLKTRLFAKKQLSINGLTVVYGRPITMRKAIVFDGSPTNLPSIKHNQKKSCWDNGSYIGVYEISALK
jgi:hypothetical protein